jgi:hypothetical protein
MTTFHGVFHVISLKLRKKIFKIIGMKCSVIELAFFEVEIFREIHKSRIFRDKTWSFSLIENAFGTVCVNKCKVFFVAAY